MASISNRGREITGRVEELITKAWLEFCPFFAKPEDLNTDSELSKDPVFKNYLEATRALYFANQASLDKDVFRFSYRATIKVKHACMAFFRKLYPNNFSDNLLGQIQPALDTLKKADGFVKLKIGAHPNSSAEVPLFEITKTVIYATNQILNVAIEENKNCDNCAIQ